MTYFSHDLAISISSRGKLTDNEFKAFKDYFSRYFHSLGLPKTAHGIETCFWEEDRERDQVAVLCYLSKQLVITEKVVGALCFVGRSDLAFDSKKRSISTDIHADENKSSDSSVAVSNDELQSSNDSEESYSYNSSSDPVRVDPEFESRMAVFREVCGSLRTIEEPVAANCRDSYSSCESEDESEEDAVRRERSRLFENIVAILPCFPNREHVFKNLMSEHILSWEMFILLESKELEQLGFTIGQRLIIKFYKSKHYI